jgi:hypothetical protein
VTRATGQIHAATLTSPRLQRVLQLMADGKPRSTRAIVRGAKVMAVSAAMSELRTHGAEISCRREATSNGEGGRWIYTMTKAPKT